MFLFNNILVLLKLNVATDGRDLHNKNGSSIFFIGANRTVSMDCSNWMDSDFTYPDQVTDVILFYQCLGGQGETLRKVKFVKQERSLLFLFNLKM